MKILNRAKSFYSDEYFISQDIKFELEMMYLRVNGVWRECEESTRSINFEDMLDSQGNKIFASLSQDGKGGDIFQYNNFTAYRELDNQTSTVVINQGRYALLIGDNFHSLFAIQGKVTGIQK